jgi:pyruvate-ferredoxin/flavodoxin oxidoreductase
MNIFPEIADDMFEFSAQNATERYRRYSRLAEHEIY